MEQYKWIAISNIVKDICLNTFESVKIEIDHRDGRISAYNIEPKHCGVYLLLNKPGDVMSIIQISVDIADTELDNKDIAINIMGKLTEHEHDVPFANFLAKSILDEYEN